MEYIVKINFRLRFGFNICISGSYCLIPKPTNPDTNLIYEENERVNIDETYLYQCPNKMLLGNNFTNGLEVKCYRENDAPYVNLTLPEEWPTCVESKHLFKVNIKKTLILTI